jgi:hypothetical protein
MDVLKGGGSVAFTPDGPRGPVRSVQPGVLALAAKMEVPVVPLAWAGRRVKELGSWDRFLIPKPFGRYAVVYGEPTFFSESGPAAEEKLKNLLIAVESQAQSALASDMTILFGLLFPFGAVVFLFLFGDTGCDAPPGVAGTVFLGRRTVPDRRGVGSRRVGGRSSRGGKFSAGLARTISRVFLVS